MKAFVMIAAALHRELLRAVRNQAPLFFALCVWMFPLGFGVRFCLLPQVEKK